MTSEIELFGKDSIKLNILKELISGDINISLSLGGGVYQDYISQIHREGSQLQVLGKFNLSEDPSGTVLIIRPIAVSGTLKVTFGFSGHAFENEKTLSVYRRATKSVERTYDIGQTLSSVEFIPQGNVKYLLRLTYSDKGRNESDAGNSSSAPAQGMPSETAAAAPSTLTRTLDGFESFSPSTAASAPSAPVPPIHPGRRTAPPARHDHPISDSDPELERLQAETQAAEDKLKNLRQRKATAKDLLKKLEAEYEKDYEEFGRELEEYKQQFGVDQSVIEYYRDYDIQPIEELIKEITGKLEQAEKQISTVILSRQRKTMEIETQIKSNKRQ